MEQVCDFASWQCPVARAHTHYQRIHIFATLQRLEIDQILPSCLPYDFAQRSSAIRGPRHRCGGAACAPAMPSHHTASMIACSCVHSDSALGHRLAGPMFWCAAQRRCACCGLFVCGYCCYVWAYPSQKPEPVKLFSALTWTQIGVSVTQGSQVGRLSPLSFSCDEIQTDAPLENATCSFARRNAVDPVRTSQSMQLNDFRA